jgi:hypothetical protein
LLARAKPQAMIISPEDAARCVEHGLYMTIKNIAKHIITIANVATVRASSITAPMISA